MRRRKNLQNAAFTLKAIRNLRNPRYKYSMDHKIYITTWRKYANLTIANNKPWEKTPRLRSLTGEAPIEYWRQTIWNKQYNSNHAEC